ncbi:MAG: hypothetical protein IPP71_23560 [Bacteroidetes bacterium]|nr:hypothetical protein [Bacteroidota bacterium]
MIKSNFIQLIHLALFLGFFMLSGCGKTDSAVSTPVPDCFDNIQNQGEFGIDCGGPCGPCPAKMTAKIDGVNWESQGNVTTVINGNSIIFLAGNGTTNMALIYNGPFTAGNFNLQSANYSITATSTNYITNVGNISFLSWDQAEQLVSGSFSFNAFESTGTGDTVHVTQGKFLFVPYQP